jgi:hypothetical protein
MKAGIRQRTWRLRTLLESVDNFAFYPNAHIRDVGRYIAKEAEAPHATEQWRLAALSYSTDWVNYGINVTN